MSSLGAMRQPECSAISARTATQPAARGAAHAVDARRRFEDALHETVERGRVGENVRFEAEFPPGAEDGGAVIADGAVDEDHIAGCDVLRADHPP